MTIRHLKIFMTVADEKSMSLAAKKLYVSQPTVSQAIAELEKYYEVKLFERLSQKIYLTREGELMLSFARHILDSFKEMEKAIGQAAEKATLCIGCSVSVGTCLINDILDKAKKRMPKCHINVLVANSAQIEKAILKNEVDLGIVEGMIQSKELIITPVFKDEVVIVCGKTHPLAKEKKITLDMLEGQDYICRESGSTERNQMERLIEEYGINLNKNFSSTNTEAIKNAVMHGHGIAVFSKMMVEKECQVGDMIILPLEKVSVTRNINLVMHKNKYISETIQTIKDILKVE